MQHVFMLESPKEMIDDALAWALALSTHSTVEHASLQVWSSASQHVYSFLRVLLPSLHLCCLRRMVKWREYLRARQSSVAQVLPPEPAVAESGSSPSKVGLFCMSAQPLHSRYAISAVRLSLVHSTVTARF
jgi:hypothetical protein